jgi:hypothetical protein
MVCDTWQQLLSRLVLKHKNRDQLCARNVMFHYFLSFVIVFKLDMIKSP